MLLHFINIIVIISFARSLSLSHSHFFVYISSCFLSPRLVVIIFCVVESKIFLSSRILLIFYFTFLCVCASVRACECVCVCVYIMCYVRIRFRFIILIFFFLLFDSIFFLHVLMQDSVIRIACSEFNRVEHQSRLCHRH